MVATIARPAASTVRQWCVGSTARPFLVEIELTRSSGFADRHCRNEPVPGQGPHELSTGEVVAVLDDLSAIGAPRPRVVFTGSDPLRRPDLQTLVAHAARAGLPAGVSVTGAPRASASDLAALRLRGATGVSFSIDGASAATHDGVRHVEGSFDWTMDACRAAVMVGLRLQVNTTVGASTVLELPGIARLVAGVRAAMWNLCFDVPTGCTPAGRALSAAETEDVLAFLYDLAPQVALETTEAPSFRRLLVHGEQGTPGRTSGALYQSLRGRLFDEWPLAERRAGPWRTSAAARRRPPLAAGDGRGGVFISHTGEVQPSRLLPVVVGNVRDAPLSEIYANSPLLKALRDPGAHHGRCGRCELNAICGGSRAQAYARSGDPLAEDPTCDYRPSAEG
jgi:radical SAM protein with 4Fe4S-binding SPASM domain